MSRTRLLVGLGNPGREYAFSRHNAGSQLVDFLGRAPAALPALEAVKSTSFMNLSGRCVLRELRRRGVG